MFSFFSYPTQALDEPRQLAESRSRKERAKYQNPDGKSNVRVLTCPLGVRYLKSGAGGVVVAGTLQEARTAPALIDQSDPQRGPITNKEQRDLVMPPQVTGTCRNGATHSLTEGHWAI